MKLTNKEAIANLNHIYGIVSPDIQRSLDLAIKALEEKPQGEWEENENGTGNCSECLLGIYYRTPTGRVFAMTKEQIIKFGYKFCPHCGAKMREGD